MTAATIYSPSKTILRKTIYGPHYLPYRETVSMLSVRVGGRRERWNMSDCYSGICHLLSRSIVKGHFLSRQVLGWRLKIIWRLQQQWLLRSEEIFACSCFSPKRDGHEPSRLLPRNKRMWMTCCIPSTIRHASKEVRYSLHYKTRVYGSEVISN